MSDIVERLQARVVAMNDAFDSGAASELNDSFLRALRDDVVDAIVEIVRLRSLTEWRPLSSDVSGVVLLGRPDGALHLGNWDNYKIHNAPRWTAYLPVPPPPPEQKP